MINIANSASETTMGSSLPKDSILACGVSSKCFANSATRQPPSIMSHPFMNTRCSWIPSVSSISTHQTFCSRLQLYSTDEDSRWHIQTIRPESRLQTSTNEIHWFNSSSIWPKKSSNCLRFFRSFQVSRGFLSHLGGTIGIPRTKGICLPEALAADLRCKRACLSGKGPFLMQVRCMVS